MPMSCTRNLRCKGRLCQNVVKRHSTIGVNDANANDNERAKCKEQMCKRRKECERLGLGRNVGSLPKYLRRCDNHPMEVVKGKSTTFTNGYGEIIKMRAKEWIGPKTAVIKAYHNYNNAHENKGVGYTCAIGHTLRCSAASASEKAPFC